MGAQFFNKIAETLHTPESFLVSNISAVPLEEIILSSGIKGGKEVLQKHQEIFSTVSRRICCEIVGIIHGLR